MKHKLKLTDKQVNKLYALVGDIVFEDEDMRDVRRRLSDILGENGAYQHYQLNRATSGVELIKEVSEGES